MASEWDIFFGDTAIPSFDDIIQNPDVETVLALAKDEQARINNGVVSDVDELEKIISDLDSIWRFDGQYGRISGEAMLWVPASESLQTYELRKQYIEDTILQSCGFIMHQENAEEEAVPEIRLLFRMSTLKSSDLPLSEVSRDMLCSVALDGVDISGFETAQSMDQAAMDMYLPDAAVELYNALYEDENTDQRNWHSTLKNIVVDVPKDNVTDGIEAMVSFVARHYDLEREQLPIIVSVTEGSPVMVVEDDDLTVGVARQNVPKYLYPYKLDLRLHCQAHSESIVVHEDKLSWVLHGTTPDENGIWTQVAIPIASLSEVRHLPSL